jgi:hypothetical protein
MIGSYTYIYIVFHIFFKVIQRQFVRPPDHFFKYSLGPCWRDAVRMAIVDSCGTYWIPKPPDLMLHFLNAGSMFEGWCDSIGPVCFFFTVQYLIPCGIKLISMIFPATRICQPATLHDTRGQIHQYPMFLPQYVKIPIMQPICIHYNYSLLFHPILSL